MLRIINTTGDVIFLEIAGVHFDWTTYKFEIDVDSPGKKIIAFQVKQGILVADTAKDNHPPSQKVEDTSDVIWVTAIECHVLAKLAHTTNENDPKLKGPLHMVGYIVHPITGPKQTIEEFLDLEHACKHTKLSY
ncbi:hypothetical protein HD554DRAFT_2175337 [Boletus coccyginus]|nr:hypothetical protein HD554DRAFT_2175337 [Boletus coccyginus]